jgi:hypothetical protein
MAWPADPIGESHEYIAPSALKWHLHRANLLVGRSATDYKELQVDFLLGKPLRTLSPLLVLTQPKIQPGNLLNFSLFYGGGSLLKNAEPIPSFNWSYLCAINRLPSELVFFIYFLPKRRNPSATESKSSADPLVAAIYLVDGLLLIPQIGGVIHSTDSSHSAHTPPPASERIKIVFLSNK